MAQSVNRADLSDEPEQNLDEPLPGANDPGGARRKGYAAEPGAERAVSEQGPLPLASDREVQAHAEKPDQSQAVQGTTSTTPAASSRVMGADR